MATLGPRGPWDPPQDHPELTREIPPDLVWKMRSPSGLEATHAEMAVRFREKKFHLVMASIFNTEPNLILHLLWPLASEKPKNREKSLHM